MSTSENNFVEISYEIPFQNKDGLEETITLSNKERNEDVYSEAREKLMNKFSIRDKTTFEKNWDKGTTKKYISYINEPWSDYNDLLNHIRSLDMVKSASLFQKNVAHPPKIMTVVDNDKNELENAVKEYYPALMVDDKNNVVISPIKYLENKD